MKHLFLLAIGTLIVAVVAFATSTIGSSDDSTVELVKMRTNSLQAEIASTKALEASGLRAGDPEYDKAVARVAVRQRGLRQANELLADSQENKSRWMSIALVASAAGFTLLGLAWLRRRKLTSRSSTDAAAASRGAVGAR